MSKERIQEGLGSAIGTFNKYDRALGHGLSTAGHFAARVADKHPAAAIGAIGGAVIGHKIAKAVDQHLPDDQHLTKRAKHRWAATGAVAGAALGAGGSLIDSVRRGLKEDSYYIGYHAKELTQNSNGEMVPKKEVFRSPTTPDGYSHPKYGKILGPYASKEDAENTIKESRKFTESVVMALNEEIDRINETSQDVFTAHTPGKPSVYPHLSQAISTFKKKAGVPSDITAKTTRGEVPLGYVDKSGFHYIRPGLEPHRIPEDKEMKEGLTFASRPMSFSDRVKEKIHEKDKWMQDVHPNKGALHRQDNIPLDQKIPTSRLRADAKKTGKLGSRSRLALRYRGL